MSQKRSIFEDVATSETPTRKTGGSGGGVIDKGTDGARRAISGWLMVLFALVVAMIVVGGLTRLTDSGLSITEWKPVTGSLPPMSEAAWQAEFAKYQGIDQWEIENQWMLLADFKQIYWWEWGHRQLGRMIGLVWGVGFLWFAARRQIPTGWTGRLLLIGALGGAQGAIGWWMVASGVTQGEGITTVASYRLAVHLGLAFVILGFIGWYILLAKRSERDLMQARRAREGRLFTLTTALLIGVFIQILLGALVAGIDAGRSYTDWPLMGSAILPPDPLGLEPLWTNFFENPGTVQFIHRTWGYVVALFAIVVWLRGRRSPNDQTRFAFHALLVGIALQMTIGVVTVITSSPLHIAIVHQAVAILVWVLILQARFRAYYPLSQSIQIG